MSVPLPLWYLPPGVPEPGSALDGILLRPESITAMHVRAAVAALDVAAVGLTALPVAAIVAAIDRALARWREPDDEIRHILLAAGPAETGYSAEALVHAIDVMLPRFGAEGLWALLRDELGDPAALDGFIAGPAGLRSARGPGRQFHVFAGSVPTAGIFSLICALLTKSPVLAKPSSHDALFPTAFARTLAAVEPRVAGALAVLPWRGGETALEDEALRGAGAVVVYGSDATVDGYRRRTPAGARFLGYGHRLSVAAVAREALSQENLDQTARRLAWDMALFDQRGCLSPQLALVERDGERSSVELAHATATRLDELCRTLPRGAVSAEEAARIRSARDAAAFQAALGRDVALFASEGSTAWTLIHRGEPEGPWPSGNRVL